MKVGAHVSAAGGLDKAIDRAKDIGAETLQMFISSPRGWHFKPITSVSQDAYLTKASDQGIFPTFFHGVYLVGLATQNGNNLSKSVQSLTNYMVAADQLGSAGVIFHVGSHKGVGFDGMFDQTLKALDQVINASPGSVSLIIENSAGMGDHMCSTFKEIGKLTRALASDRIKVCLDTQHMFAAGYDVVHEVGLQRTMEEFDREIGLSNLVAVHANDSKTQFNSAVDRHENIGEGYIGLDGFRVIMSHHAFTDIPFLLEVPGPDNKGPDRSNVDALKSIRTDLGIKQ